MLDILGRSSSINVRKVLWCATELGLPFANRELGNVAGELQASDYLSLNPNGKVPTIVDGDFTMWESNAICRFLAARAGRVDLLPAAPAARAHVEQWMDWQATDLNVSWRYAFLHLIRKSPAHADPAAAQASVVEWNRHMAMLDGQLAKTGAYITGDQFTLADLVIGVSTVRWKLTPIERMQLPAVEAWFGRISERPSFVQQTWTGTP
jgi:glutathione S-transferase